MEERLSLVLPEYTDNAYMVYDDNENFNWQRAYESHIMGDKSRSIEETKAAFLQVSPDRLRAMAGEFCCRQPGSLYQGDRKRVDEEEIRRAWARIRREDERMSRTFKQEFFRIYDRKIGSRRNHLQPDGHQQGGFYQIVYPRRFRLQPEAIERLALNMKLTDEERLLLSSAERETAR